MRKYNHNIPSSDFSDETLIYIHIYIYMVIKLLVCFFVSLPQLVGLNLEKDSFSMIALRAANRLGARKCWICSYIFQLSSAPLNRMMYLISIHNVTIGNLLLNSGKWIKQACPNLTNNIKSQNWMWSLEIIFFKRKTRVSICYGKNNKM